MKIIRVLNGAMSYRSEQLVCLNLREELAHQVAHHLNVIGRRETFENYQVVPDNYLPLSEREP